MPTLSKSAAEGAKDNEILASAAAEALGLTAQSIGQWTSRPGAPVRKAGNRVFVRWPDFARWREQELVAQAKKEATADGDFEMHRSRKMSAEASLAEIELAKAQRELVAVEDFSTALGNILQVETARLRGLPARMAEYGPEVEEALEREIEDMIEEMHNFDQDVLSDPSHAELDGQTAPPVRVSGR